MAESERTCEQQDDDSIVKELERHMQREDAKEVEAASFDSIAQKLIKNNLILTALELHAELQEVGKELPRLRDYFSNPANFEKSRAAEKSSSPVLSLHKSGSCETFDSIDWARYSDDGTRQADERTAALEFELRKAQDTIRSLRAALTQATEHNFNTDEDTASNRDSNATNFGIHSGERATVKAHEKRAINFLVNEYLLAQDYKLSSVTFAEENSNQDFESWEDVGLNIPKPPDLITLYRDYGQHVIPTKEHCDVCCECDDGSADQISSLRDHNEQLVMKLADTDHSLQDCHATIDAQTDELQQLRATIAELMQKLAVETNSSYSTVPSTIQSREDQPAESASVAAVPITAIQGDDVLDGPSRPINSGLCCHCHNGNDIKGTSRETERHVYDYEPCSRNVSTLFRDGILSLAVNINRSNRIAREILNLTQSSVSAVVSVVSRSIPHILPNVLLAKREELIPIILCAATLNEDAVERDKLLNCLFNLIKKPDDDQRHMILAGCVMFAQLNGPQRVEAELLPQCWEQINDKREERRLLVAEACSALIPYLSGGIRSSLVLSMLQQMLYDEKISFVRAAIVKSLGVLTAFVDAADKYSQVQDLLFRVMNDQSDEVRLAGQQVFLPSVALWASELGTLETGLSAALLFKLEQCIATPSEAGDVALNADCFKIILNYLTQLIPFWFTSVVKNNPYFLENKTKVTSEDAGTAQHVNWWQSHGQSLLSFAALDDGEHQLSHAITVFDSCIREEWYKTWDQFDFICKDLMSKVIQVLLVVDLTYSEAVLDLVSFMSAFIKVFGKRFTDTKIKPRFTDLLRFPEQTPLPQSLQKVIARSSLVPVYVCGILSVGVADEAGDAEQLRCFLQQLLVVVTINKLPRDSIATVFEILCTSQPRHIIVLQVLEDCMTHKSYAVRAGVAKLFELVVKRIDTEVIESRVLPMLSALAQDGDLAVRTATVSVYGAILERARSSQILDKVYADFQKLLDDPANREQHVMLLEFISVFTKVVPNAEPRFRDEMVLPRLAGIAATNNHNSGGAVKRLEVALRLVEAYSALSCCFISTRLISEAFLPGLRCVLQDVKDLSPGQHVDTVLSMVRDFEGKLAAEAPAQDVGHFASTEANAAAPQQHRHGRYNVLSKLKDFKDKPSHGLFTKKK